MRDNAWIALAIVGIIIAFALSSSNGASDAFTTIAVPNGTNPVATSSSDTLTFAEGSNITITGDAGSDTVTIAATGAGSGDIASVGDCDTGDCFNVGGIGSELTFDPSNSVTYEEGRIYYDSDINAFTAFNNEPDVALNIGEETWTFVRNNTGSTITSGQAVYISGAVGNIPTVALAQADATTTSNVVAVATHDIENNTTGYVTTFGAIRDLDTSAFLEGDTLFLSATTPGELSTTRPTSPNFDVFVGTVTVAHLNDGILYVDIRGRSSRIDCNGPNDALTFTLTTDVFGCNTISSATEVDVELNGTPVITDTDTLDFLSPFNVTDDAGDAQIDLPLADDNVFVGDASGEPAQEALPDCDAFNEALNYSDSNDFPCQPISTKAKISHQVASDHWVVPGWYCRAVRGILQNVDVIHYFPVHASQDETYTAIGLNVILAGAGGSIARLGVYNGVMTSQGLEIGTLLLDAGTVAVDSTGAKSLAVSLDLEKGQYYWLAHVSNDTPTFTRCDAREPVSGPIEGFASALGAPPAFGAFADLGGGAGALAANASPDATIAIAESVGVVMLLE